MIKKDKLVRASAFRAVSKVNQNVPANTFVKVLFQNEFLLKEMG